MIPSSNSALAACVDAASFTVRGSVETVRWFSFWTAAILPILYIPTALAMELLHVDVWTVGKLLALHIAALFFGRSYGRDGG